MNYEKEYKRKALEPIVNYIESVMASYSKEELEERIKKALPEMESEDERIRKEMIHFLKSEKAFQTIDLPISERWIAYLEKQKEQKPVEWSKEDELMRTAVIQTLERFGGRGTTGMQIDWLKSLRPQPSWKPSEDLEKEAVSYCFDNGINLSPRQATDFARHFAEWQKEQSSGCSEKPNTHFEDL